MGRITGRYAIVAGALSLALGVLGARTAHAQTAGATQHRYQARIAGAQVTFQGAYAEAGGKVSYSYDVALPAASGFYEVEDGLTSRAAVLTYNAMTLRAARKVLSRGTSAHKDGVWAVLERKGATCSMMAGAYWRHLAFIVSVAADDCARAMSAAGAEFSGVSLAVGRHSPVGIPPLALAAAPAPAPAPTATPVPAPAGVTYQGVMVECPKIYSDSDGMFPPKVGDQYVVAHIVVTNNSDQNQDYNTFDFRLADQNDVRYTAFAMDSNISDHSLGSGTLAPGQTVAGDIAFEVPSSITKIWLLWTPDFMAPAQYVPLH